MANTFLTADNVARTASAIVGQDMNLSALIHRDLEASFSAGKGNVVKVRVPGAVVANTRGIYDTATPLTSDEIAEQSIDVTLTDHAYNNVVLSEGDLDLEIADYARQVLRPQATAIVKFVERAVATAMQATPENTALAYARLRRRPSPRCAKSFVTRVSPLTPRSSPL
ncbi:P22 phage major capsid protein family protein [Arthrobacter sp. ISL-28]|uniref:P22 phage major capsid protein family protein n=1 Tax=Arthrobacter sp. ISL-28 TaxID=2819108 RepID=UPI001BE97E25|nr:P22 phage major capsid protein family protein [Arthrobacter sp. ISL-28]MBT2523266.1 hypothetical protein [Arthrobacter sp. ISL-28]